MAGNSTWIRTGYNTMSTLLSSDPCTDIILDFIAGGVPDNQSGESAGNYNATIGDIEGRTYGDLSRRTFADIYVCMADMLARGKPSTATGRYQIIRRTLKPLAAKLGYGDGDLFTYERQDALAVQLLIGRNYPAWWRGAITDAEFAHGISLEWASLPDPERGGASHYDGVGANHASTTLAHVYDMLTRARDAKLVKP
jgi:muramidase (phage lysozyme)